MPTNRWSMENAASFSFSFIFHSLKLFNGQHMIHQIIISKRKKEKRPRIRKWLYRCGWRKWSVILGRCWSRKFEINFLLWVQLISDYFDQHTHFIHSPSQFFLSHSLSLCLSLPLDHLRIFKCALFSLLNSIIIYLKKIEGTFNFKLIFNSIFDCFPFHLASTGSLLSVCSFRFHLLSFYYAFSCRSFFSLLLWSDVGSSYSIPIRVCTVLIPSVAISLLQFFHSTYA